MATSTSKTKSGSTITRRGQTPEQIRAGRERQAEVTAPKQLPGGAIQVTVGNETRIVEPNDPRFKEGTISVSYEQAQAIAKADAEAKARQEATGAPKPTQTTTVGGVQVPVRTSYAYSYADTLPPAVPGREERITRVNIDTGTVWKEPYTSGLPRYDTYDRGIPYRRETETTQERKDIVGGGSPFWFGAGFKEEPPESIAKEAVRKATEAGKEAYAYYKLPKVSAVPGYVYSENPEIAKQQEKALKFFTPEAVAYTKGSITAVQIFGTLAGVKGTAKPQSASIMSLGKTVISSAKTGEQGELLAFGRRYAVSKEADFFGTTKTELFGKVKSKTITGELPKLPTMTERGMIPAKTPIQTKVIFEGVQVKTFEPKTKIFETLPETTPVKIKAVLKAPEVIVEDTLVMTRIAQAGRPSKMPIKQPEFGIIELKKGETYTRGQVSGGGKFIVKTETPTISGGQSAFSELSPTGLKTYPATPKTETTRYISAMRAGKGFDLEAGTIDVLQPKPKDSFISQLVFFEKKPSTRTGLTQLEKQAFASMPLKVAEKSTSSRLPGVISVRTADSSLTRQRTRTQTAPMRTTSKLSGTSAIFASRPATKLREPTRIKTSPMSMILARAASTAAIATKLREPTRIKTSPMSMILARVATKSAITTKIKLKQAPAERISFRVPSSPMFKPPKYPKEPPVFTALPFALPHFDMPGKGLKMPQVKRKKRGYAYTPSITAGIFGVSSRISKAIREGGQLTGLEFRPLPNGRRRK